jgi:hypothetical protein
LTYDLRLLLGRFASAVECGWNAGFRRAFERFEIPGFRAPIFQGAAAAYDFPESPLRSYVFQIRAAPTAHTALRPQLGFGEELATLQAYEIVIIVARRRDLGYEFYRSRIQVGDLRFGWSVPKPGKIEVAENSGPFWALFAGANGVDELIWISHIGNLEHELEQALLKVAGAHEKMTVLRLDRKLFQDLTADLRETFLKSVRAFLSGEIVTKCYVRDLTSAGANVI